MELTTFQTIKTIPINDTIIEAHFLDASNELVIVFGATSTYIIDLLTN